MRRYWIPAASRTRSRKPDSPPVRVKLLGEKLVVFRDTQGRVGLLDERCPHRTASLFFGRNEECGLRCVYHGWKFDVEGNCVDLPSEPRDYNLQARDQGHGLSLPRARRRGLDLYGPAGAQAGVPRARMDPRPGRATASSPATSRNATGCRASKAASTRATCPSCTAAARTRRWRVVPTRYEVVPTDFGFVVGTGRDMGADGTFWTVNVMLMPFHKIIASSPMRGARLGADRRREHDALQHRLQPDAAADRGRPRALEGLQRHPHREHPRHRPRRPEQGQRLPDRPRAAGERQDPTPACTGSASRTAPSRN